MRLYRSLLNVYVALFFLFIFSCDGQNKSQKLPVMSEVSNDLSVVIQRDSVNSFEYGSADVITSGLLDKEGNLWFGTTTKGVIRYDGKKFTVYSESHGLCSNHVSSMIEDKNGILWLGTAEGLCTFDGNNFVHIPIPNYDDGDFPTNSKEVLTLIQAQNGDFWIGTWGGGAYRFDGKEFESYLQEDGMVYEDGNYHNVIQDIFEDKEGNIWFASMSHGGVSRFDGESMEHFSVTDGLGDDMVFVCFQDDDGKMWFGTRDGGISFFDEKSFTSFTMEDGLCHNNVSCFMQDESGKLWMGSFRRSGVCLYLNETFTSFPAQDSQILEDIRVILQDRNGSVWFAGRYGQLWRFDGRYLTEFTHSWEL